MTRIISFALWLTIYGSWNRTTQERELILTPATAPFSLTVSAATFHKNISYGEDTLTVFDFFKPGQHTSSSLCILIHGGGFVGGDKSQPYSSKNYMRLINNLLSNNIAVASINYRLIETNDSIGILKCLNDSKVALQFMRFHSKSLHINKTKVVIMGSSAGAGTALWIGFSDEMAEPGSPDPVLWESTRIQGIVCTATQSNYDIVNWHKNVFSEYQLDGFDYNTVKNIMTEATIFKCFGVRNPSELFSPEILAYRNRINMLELMSDDDPEFYVSNSGILNKFPSTTGELYHHPLHVKALQNKAASTNSPGVFHCPELGIDTRKGETMEEFIIRKIGN